MKKPTNFIIDIVPLTRIPLTRNQSFSYLHPEKLPAGTLVSIPLFRRKVEGIVLGSKDDFKRHGGIELKKLEKMIEKSFLTDAQMKLAQFISEYYIAPLGIVLKGFSPKRVKSRNKEQRTKNREQKNIVLTDEQESAVKKIIDCKSKVVNCKFLLFGPAGSGKTEVYIHSMLKIREKDKTAQFLVLVPEKTLTPQAVERYGQYFAPEEMAVLSSNISRGQFYENWRRIKSGEVKIIIATRIGVMAPFGNLRLIVIDEEQDMSYKNWDMNPRYDARTVAEKLGELYKCSIVRGSATPSVESYYRAINNELKLIKTPEFRHGAGYNPAPANNFEPSPVPQSGTSSPASGRGGYCTNTILVDMKKERWAKNYSCISKKLKYEIGYALKNKLQTILLINRQGMSSFSVCESCKTVLKCPKCDRAVIYDNRGYYKCAHCAYKTSITPKCGKCGGLVFKNVGLGTQKVEREINNIFSTARVARIDSQSIRVKNYQEKIYNEFSQGQIDILVGTQMITKGWDLPNVTLVGIIDTDNMLSIPDFSAGQKAYELINQVAGRVNRPGAKWPGVVVVQSYNPENKLLKLIAQGNYAGFFEREIAERKALKLPPIGRIIKLTIQDYDKKRAEKSAQGVYDLLKNTADDISVSEPQEAYISNIRGRFRRQIILKTTGEKWPAQTIKLLKALSSAWIVDVDPISII